MTVHIVRLGMPRLADEGLRIGTVRHPPRGVPKHEHASGNWYDVWQPDLSPTAELVRLAKNATNERDWSRFERRFRSQMNQPGPARLLDLLAALSQQADFSVGCYCEDEARCHRSVLRSLLHERGAKIV